MIILIVLGLSLILAFMNGYRYGFVNTLARSIGYFAIAIIAFLFAHPLGKIIANFINNSYVAFRPNVPVNVINQGNQFLASSLSFAIIYIIGGFFVHSILKGLNFIKKIPVIGFVNALLGGIISLVLTYVICFFILQMLSLMNIDWVRNQFVQAPILNAILDKTPILSDQIYQWWISEKSKL